MTGVESESRVNILLVDDRPENLMVLEGVLEPLGQNLVRAMSGAEALRRLLQDDFAVVLLDVQMPGMDGFETAAMIRSRDQCRSTPIVFVTAYERSLIHIQRGYALGAVDYLFKPVVPEVLKAKVRAFVDLALKARELEAEVTRRVAAEAEVRRLNERLEKRVAERTLALRNSNRALRKEIAERKKIEGERLGLLGRERAARAEAEAANTAKDNFLAVLSHELRSPLTSILGWVCLLRSGSMDEKRRERGLEVIERSTRRQAQLIEDLLDVSRIVAGRLRFERQHVDVLSVIRSAVEEAAPAAEAAGIHIIMPGAPGEIEVMGDRERLHQVVWNLLSNAVKFTPAGGTITITLNREENQAVLTVADTGAGIAPDLLPHVFERFRQHDSGPTRSYGGLGLGLAIVHYLVQAHGGVVEASSAGTGQGATFTVRLPLSDDEQGE